MEDYALTMDGCLRLNEILQKKIANDMPGELADVLSTLMASDIKGKLKVRPARGACPGQPAKLRRRSSDACLHANPQNIAESKLGATVQKLTKHDDGKVNSLATKLKNSWAAAAAQAKAAKVEPAPAAAAAAAAAASAAGWRHWWWRRHWPGGGSHRAPSLRHALSPPPFGGGGKHRAPSPLHPPSPPPFGGGGGHRVLHTQGRQGRRGHMCGPCLLLACV